MFNLSEFCNNMINMVPVLRMLDINYVKKTT